MKGTSPSHAAGAAELRQPKVARAKLNAPIASLPPCVIGMEACSGAHHWARLFQAYGHTVRLIARSSSPRTARAEVPVKG